MKRVYVLEAKSEADAMAFLLDMNPTANSTTVKADGRQLTVETCNPDPKFEFYNRLLETARKYSVTLNCVMEV